ncbi:MAG: DUF4330 domain-containing protein [Leptolyngbyaceae bacterium]|nr:DUF4330 domain-containing protein [Leptolyngbyaceae bacterium]
MAILDSSGRLFGKVSILDVGAAVVIGATIAGIFLVPGDSGSVAQIGATRKPVEVDLIVRGLTVSNPEALVQSIRDEGQTEIIIRNQTYGQVAIKSVQELPRSVATPQPDGSVQAFPDPRPELDFTVDMLITLTGEAQISNNAVVFGNNKMKIGNSVTIEGLTYQVNTSIVGVRILGD